MGGRTGKTHDGERSTSDTDARDLHLRGVQALKAGELGFAAELIAGAARLNPGQWTYHSDLGLALSRLGLTEDARQSFEAAIALNPRAAIVHINLAVVLKQMGERRGAVGHLKNAIKLDPKSAQAHNNLGCIQRDMGQFPLARRTLQTALALQPGSSSILNNLANVLRDMGRHDLALARFADVARLRPDSFDAQNNLGVALRAVDQLDEALELQRVAAKLNPNDADVQNNLGVTLQRMRRIDEALEAFRAALSLKPACGDAKTNLAMALLLVGRFEEGWLAYEARWDSRYMVAGRRALDPPQWDGALLQSGALGPRTLLIHAEQGFGDTLQFCRYVPKLCEDHKVVLEVQPALATLMRRLAGGAQVISRGDPLPPFDAHCPLMSLPLAIGAAAGMFSAPYLSCSREMAAVWTERLGPAYGLRVGLVWAGGARANAEMDIINRRRSMTLERLRPLFAIPDVRFISLQYGLEPEALADARRMRGLEDYTADIADFDDTAALIDTLDLVISVDTAVAHLAGGLGKPVWLLNRFDPCWRWGLGGDVSPWYPRLRQFRQSSPGDWEGVIAAVAAALRDAAETARG